MRGGTTTYSYDAARRLIDSDGAHLTLMAPGGRFLRPTVVVGGNPAWTAAPAHAPQMAHVP